jgi:O-antigen/teichoic acid export membrane protein
MSRLAFFRQSSWMLFATVVAGGFGFLVHIVMKKPVEELPLGAFTQWLSNFVKAPLNDAAYGLFTALLPFIYFLGMPSGGLQVIFSQQAASITTDQQLRELRHSVRVVLRITFAIWFFSAAIVLLFKRQFLGGLKIDEPPALWFTLITGLLVLWTPILGGVLQGQQNFLWFGWSSILSGVGRCAVTFILVRLLGGGITAAMAAVFAGSFAAFAICAWQTRQIWLGPRAPFHWREWLGRVVPLTLGLAVTTFIMNADAIFVRWRFPETATGLYGAAGIIGRALVFFTVPLTTVMFPKIVQSAARAERTDVMALALGATALLGVAAAGLCTLVPGLPLKIGWGESTVKVKELVPWFAWCMLPLTWSNVLINNLLARERFKVVPWLVLVALGYGAVLLAISGKLSTNAPLPMDGFKVVVRTLGVFSSLLFAVSLWFTWKTTDHARSPSAPTAATT